eukprot:Seg1817.2 transcript_id=Seg1817.2/GoldUCD/mRNA.D3Y31 product="hypothetical protein" protein_id=Seg1817.2/GoldUCD/D3Y31
MAVTSSLSCVDYLSFKFGCQSLNNEKKSIYEHLSQELFCAAPLLKEFNFHSKQQDTRNIFSQDFAADKKCIFQNSSKNAVQRKHRHNRGFFNKSNDNFRSTREARVSWSTKPFLELEGLKNKENVLTDKVILESFDLVKIHETRNEERKEVRRNISLKEIETNLSWINKELEDCVSDSESELLQICGEEIHDCHEQKKRWEKRRLETQDYETRGFEAPGFAEACNSKYSRKRSSTESLDSLDDDNLAKRKRPSINVIRMQDSRLCINSRLQSNTDTNKQCFVPISFPVD